MRIECQLQGILALDNSILEALGFEGEYPIIE